MRTLAILILALPLAAAEYYVAPNGNDANPGTIEQPWALTKLCRTTRSATPMSAVSPGDRVWVRGGSYYVAGELFCEHIGTEESPITLEAYPGEVPEVWTDKLTGGNMFTLGGSYQIIKGFRFYTASQRVTFLPGSNTAVQAPALVNTTQQLLGPPTGNQIINCVGHDGTGFVSATEGDIGTRYEGNIVFSMGRDAPDRLHGGAMYAQNNPADPPEIHRDNVFLNNGWYHNDRGYKTSGTLGNFIREGNIVYGGSNFWYPVSTSEVMEGLVISHMTFVGNYTLGAALSGGAGDVKISDSAFVDFGSGEPLRLAKITDAEITDSVIVGFRRPVFYDILAGGSLTADRNAYWQYDQFHWDRRCFTMTGPDVADGSVTVRPYSNPLYPTYWGDLDPHPEPNSTCATGYPPTNWVKIRPNARESGRAHVAVVNFAGSTAQNVDLSAVFSPGDRYEVIDLWNPLAGAVLTGVYDGSDVPLPLTGTSLYVPDAQTTACWQTDRANCLTSGDFVVADAVENLPAGTYENQAAVLSTNYMVYRWTGSAWSSTSTTISTHAGPEYTRLQNAHAFLVRRLYDGRAETTLAWRGAVTDVLEAGYLKPDASITWGELPVTQIACADGRCRAKVPQSLGNAYWRINGGVALKAAARGRETVPVIPDPLASPWSADFSEDFGPGGAN